MVMPRASTGRMRRWSRCQAKCTVSPGRIRAGPCCGAGPSAGPAAFHLQQPVVTQEHPFVKPCPKPARFRRHQLDALGAQGQFDFARAPDRSPVRAGAARRRSRRRALGPPDDKLAAQAVALAEKAGHERRFRLFVGVERAWPPVAAGHVHDDDPIAQRHGLGLVVRHQQAWSRRPRAGCGAVQAAFPRAAWRPGSTAVHRAAAVPAG